MQEEEMIKGILAGGRQQEQALKALYAKAAEWRRYFIYKGRLSRDDAEELVQDTICKIFRSAASFSGSGGFGDASANAWMRQVAKNCLMDALRKTKVADLDIESLEVTTGNKIADLEKGTGIYRNQPRQIDGEECVSLGIEAFAGDHPDRAIVLEMQMDGEDIQSIANRIGRTVGATKEYLSQCKKKLAPYIEHCLSLLPS